MAPEYDDSPEVAPGHSLPEVYNPQRQQEAAWSPQQSSIAPTYTSHSPAKPEGSVPAVGGYGTESQYQQAPGSTTGTKRKGVICGCTLLVFVLSIIIAILSAAVIGLAAGTGVAASNYNDANSKLDDLRVSYSSLLSGHATATGTGTGTATSASASATSTSYSNITNGCSDANEKTTGDTYQPDFFDKPTFTMYCNKDAANTPMLSLFAADFNTCMDACAAWNSYNASKTDCKGVSFIPLWSITEFAVEGNAPGDCYLKPGPQNKTGLGTPNIGTECHAAILDK
ncbi:Fc.00g087510.m01.CDS01 [Cosmosporella sp. VM-42]